jgi:hypothetical protein
MMQDFYANAVAHHSAESTAKKAAIMTTAPTRAQRQMSCYMVIIRILAEPDAPGFMRAARLLNRNRWRRARMGACGQCACIRQIAGQDISANTMRQRRPNERSHGEEPGLPACRGSQFPPLSFEPQFSLQSVVFLPVALAAHVRFPLVLGRRLARAPRSPRSERIDRAEWWRCFFRIHRCQHPPMSALIRALVLCVRLGGHDASCANQTYSTRRDRWRKAEAAPAVRLRTTSVSYGATESTGLTKPPMDRCARRRRRCASFALGDRLYLRVRCFPLSD